MGDLEGRGGGSPRGPHGVSVLPIDWPCTQRVTWGSMDEISPIVLRTQHSFLVEKEYMCKVVTEQVYNNSGSLIACFKFYVKKFTGFITGCPFYNLYNKPEMSVKYS